MLFDYRASVSDVQLFREEPALWVLKHHPDYQYRTESGAAAQRGHAVEYGMRAMLRFGLRAKDALPLAERDYLKRMGVEGVVTDLDDKAYKEFNDLGGYLDQCQNVIDAHGLQRYHAYQNPIVGEIEGVPFLGYTDFTFLDHGIDLKSTGRMPSEMRDTHQEQMAYYEMVTGIRFACAYVTPKKWNVYTLTDEQFDAGLARLAAAVRSIKVVLNQMTWSDTFLLFPPRDLTSFRWDETSRFYATNIWRI